MSETVWLDAIDAADWSAFVDESPQGIFYAKRWWLDAVAPGRSAILAVRNGQRIQAGWPVVWDEVGRHRRIVMPPLTQKLGILFAPSSAAYPKELSQQHQWSEALIAGLPAAVTISQNFHENYISWLPFHWHGFKQSTRYTHLLLDLGDVGALWEGMQGTTRNVIRKAQQAGVSAVETEDVAAFYDLFRKTFLRQGMPPPCAQDLVERIDRACRENAGRRIWIARGRDGRDHAGLFLAFDRRCAVLLMSGGDPELRSSGAGSLLTWEAIRFAATVSARFDFEGSMIRSVAGFYRDFGGRQCPYSRIWGRRGEGRRAGVRASVANALRRLAGALDGL